MTMNSMLKIFYLSLLTCSAVFAQSKTDYTKLGQNEKVGRFAPIRGIQMYYEIYGAGQPLLFIHGNGGSMKDFSNQVEFFSKKFKVILADSRAQGKSVDDRDSLSFEMMADDFAALLDHLKIDSSYVVGWSDGGINSLLLAMRHSKKVKKLVTTGANLWPDETALDPWVINAIKHEYDSLTKLPSTVERSNRRKLFKLMLDQPHIKTEELKKINCPALVIGGDNDVILSSHTHLISKSIPKSYLWILPSAGHSTLMAHKDDFNRIVMDFFSKPYRKIEGKDKIW